MIKDAINMIRLYRQGGAESSKAASTLVKQALVQKYKYRHR